MLTRYHPALLSFSQVTIVFQSQIRTSPKTDVKSCNASRGQGPPALLSRLCDLDKPCLPHTGPVCQLLVPLDPTPTQLFPLIQQSRTLAGEEREFNSVSQMCQGSGRALAKDLLVLQALWPQYPACAHSPRPFPAHRADPTHGLWSHQKDPSTVAGSTWRDSGYPASISAASVSLTIKQVQSLVIL